MRATARLGVIVALILVAGFKVRADVWDSGVDNDDAPGTTDSELIHGSLEVHDLGVRPGPAADQDWYRMTALARSSYEVIVDGLTGDVSEPLALPSSFTFDRVLGDGVTVLQSASKVTGQTAWSLRWEHTSASLMGQFLVARSADCGTSCTSDDQYRIRFYETTIAVPRFNNAGSQVTVLIIQNPADYTATGTAWFWSTAGALLGSRGFGLPGKNTLVLNTSALSGVAGASGSITISHNARFGDLAVKAIALEPSTGFSFDSPGLYRPN